MISGKIKTEVKHFKTESSKHLSESLTWYKKQINFLKNKCKSKYMITAKLSKTIENLKSKNTQVSNIVGCSNELISTHQRATFSGHHVRVII